MMAKLIFAATHMWVREGLACRILLKLVSEISAMQLDFMDRGEYFFRCGHCIHFAPTFKQLAADVNGLCLVHQEEKLESIVTHMEGLSGRCDHTI